MEKFVEALGFLYLTACLFFWLMVLVFWTMYWAAKGWRKGWGTTLTEVNLNIKKSCLENLGQSSE